MVMLVNMEAKTVEEYLNEIDYSGDEDYVPSQFALEFVTFIKLVNGEQGEENKTPVIHYKMLDQIHGKKKNICNMCARGMAKTTLLGEYFFLYLAVYGSIPGFGGVDLCLYVSDSIENGVKNMRKNLEHRWENSEFLQHYLPEKRLTDIRWEFTNIEGKKLVVKGYGAKALALDTRLYTVDGYTTIGDCYVGQKIYAPDGKLAEITAKSEVFNKPMYELVLDDGRTLKVSEDHINSVTVNTKPNGTANWEDKDLTTKELLKLGWTHTKKGNKKHKGVSKKCTVKIRNNSYLEYPVKQFQVNPYTLGLILGDGSIKKKGSGVVLTGSKSDTDFYRTKIPYEQGKDYIDKRTRDTNTFSIKGINQNIRNLGLDVHGNDKFIPEGYFFGSYNQRLELLKGLLDTDGSIYGNGRITFVSASYKLTSGVANLVRSLGGKAKIRGLANVNAHLVEIWMNTNPFKLPRKAKKFVPYRKNWNYVNLVDIRRISDEPSQCIAIDSYNHQFLAGEYMRTHNTGVRGAKEMGKRPDLAVLDDLISDEDARSATVISSIEDTIYKAVTYALHPTKSKIIWSGTPFNSKDPLYKAVESGAWYVNVYPVCEQFPVSKEEFRGGWEDRFTYEYVNQQYETALKTGKIDTFNQELMLRIMSDEDRLVQDSDIQWYKRDTLLNNRDLFNFYITTDFATSEKTSADYSVISVWAYNNNGDWFWVDGVCKRQLMDANVNDLFRLAQIYRPQSVGIEVTGQQGGFIQWIQNEMLARNIYFTLASDKNSGAGGIRPNTNKMERFNVVVPWFKLHKIKFPEEKKLEDPMKECMDELRLAAASGFKSKHDDFLDTISMLGSIQAWKPSQIAPVTKQENNDIWDIDMGEEIDNALDSYLV